MAKNHWLWGLLVGVAVLSIACAETSDVEAGQAEAAPSVIDDSTAPERATTAPPTDQGATGSTNAGPAVAYDRDETIKDLVESGVDEPAAICIVDGMEEEIGVERLGETGDPTPEETKLIEQVTIDCVLG